MREYSDIFEFRPSLIGSIDVAATAVGSPIDTIGFADVLATLVAGAAQGTAINACALTVKIQESASALGTGALWSDITNGVINGSFKFPVLSISGTDPAMQMGKLYERLSSTGRSRYIRAHASLAGTAGIGLKYCVSFLLGRPVDTLYVQNAVVQPTGNAEVTSHR